MIPIAVIPISLVEVLSVSEKLALRNLLNESHVTEFENKLAKYVGSKRVFACNSGRTALYLALKALELDPGDEVLVPAYSCAIVFEMILRAGLKPVFVDVNPETYNLNLELIPKAVISKTRAIVPVHLFGRPCDMEPIAEASDKYGLYIIEDVAQALGAEYKGQKAGSFGSLAIFSFGPGKSITGGEGGAIAVNNPDLLESIESLQSQLPNPSLKWRLHVAKNILALKTFANRHVYGIVRNSVDSNIKEADDITIKNCTILSQGKCHGLYPNFQPSKMPEISAAMIEKQLLRLDDFNEKRIMNANKLGALLKDENGKTIRLPPVDAHKKNTFTRFAIRIIKGNRDLVAEEMLTRTVDAKEMYHYIAELLPKLSKEKFPNAEVLSNCLLALPNHPLLTETDLNEISSSLVSALRAI